MKKEAKDNEKVQIEKLGTTNNFSKIKKNKIEEYIELMKEYQINCVNDHNFIEAEIAKQRVIQLKKKQEKKEYKKVIKRQSVDMKKFNGLKDKKIKEFKKELNNKFNEDISNLEEMLCALKKKHEKELNEYFTNFNKNYPKEVKPSIELIEKQKQLEYYIKKEE